MGKSKFAICAIIKNEHRYLKEWIEYNLSLGFDAIHLYEDGGDSHISIVRRYKQVVLHQFSECERTEYNDKDWKQMDMASHFLKAYDYDWVAFIDPDEYIRFEEGWSLEYIDKHFEDHTGVYMLWRMIGSCGHVTRPKMPIQYTYHYEGYMFPTMYRKNIVKSLVRRGGELRNIHKVKKGVYPDGRQVMHKPIYYGVWVDHYFTKSWEEWLDRFEVRGDVAQGNRKIGDFFYYNRNTKECYDYYVRTRKPVGVVLGCGDNILEGWMNTDLVSTDKAFPLDARKTLPFYDETLRFVYSEHMVEHLSAEDGERLSKEVHRVLKAGGVFRLALPTQEMFERVTDGYLQWHFDMYMPNGERTKERFIKNFSTMWGHKKIYSTPELCAVLEKIGFKTKVKSIGESEYEELRGIEHHGDIIPKEFNEIETTVIEATK